MRLSIAKEQGSRLNARGPRSRSNLVAVGNEYFGCEPTSLRKLLQSMLEQNPTNLNQGDSHRAGILIPHCVLDKEAGMHGQGFVGGFANQGGAGG